MDPNQPSAQDMANSIQQLQAQLAAANDQIRNQQNSIQSAENQLGTMTNELNQARQQLSHPMMQPKVNKPTPYTGKGSIISWTTHLDNYLRGSSEEMAFSIAVSYLSSVAHEWWMVFQASGEGTTVTTWTALKAALIFRFDTLNRKKIARDKLAKWKQLKDVPTFNEDFQKILLDIPDISMGEKIDRYTRGLKPYIWRELCTREYLDLVSAMRDAERIESAHRRIGDRSSNASNSSPANGQVSSSPTQETDERGKG